MQMVWIYFSYFVVAIFNLEIHTVSGQRGCPPQVPTDVKPACPGLFLASIRNQEACKSANNSCCFNGSASAEYSKCYYVPDLQQTVYNVAFGKPTHSSTTAVGSKNWRAVNGCKKDYRNWNSLNRDILDIKCCFHSSIGQSQAWWSVDLMERMPVKSVTITANASSDMEVTVSAATNSPDPNVTTNLVKCATNAVTFTTYETKIIPCAATINERYVIIQLTSASNQKHLALCDVQVETAGLFNAALGRATWQVETLNIDGIDSSAYKNVDGSLSNEFWNSQCTHTIGNWNPWWSVDLGQIQTVYSVTLLNRGDNNRRLKWLTISVSNSTHMPTNNVCGTHQPEIPTGAAQNIRCTNPVNTKFVIVQKTGDKELVMCEVIVEAGCVYNKYGQNCWKNCNCRNKVPCDRFTGLCSGGECEKGYKGNKCDEVCTNNMFGYNCLSGCNCLNDPKCDRVTGSCSDGQCKHGYKGENCSIPCDNERYGINCNSSCHNCKIGDVCAREFGDCPNGCEKGFKGPKCDKPCTDSFGYDCSHLCQCLNGTCNPQNGSCSSGFCNPGFMGQNCSIVCPPDKYGVNCEKSCPSNCKNRSCDGKTGSCTCITGYQGQFCDKPCSNGTYGLNCLTQCSGNCANDAFCLHITGHCPSTCKAGFTNPKCDKKIDSGGSGVGAIAGAVVAVIVALAVVAVVVVIVLLRRRKKQQKSQKYAYTEDPKPDEVHGVHDNGFTNIGMDSISDSKVKSATIKPGVPEKPMTLAKPHQLVTEKSTLIAHTSAPAAATQDEIYENADTLQPKTVIQVSGIGAYVDGKKIGDKLQQEYETIPRSVSSVEYAEKKELKIKNRYKNILPYDNNRVKLIEKGDDELSDYINAGYIKDYQGDVTYIAALGTTEYTIDDFWRMIWEQNVQVIIMVTNLVEEQKVKCIQYWPDYPEMITTKGGLVVGAEATNMETLHYIKRTFKLSQNDSTREITQYHYIEWPDKGVPENIAGLYKVIQKMKHHRSEKHTPILVHCSAGVGRTGTIIALDILLDQAKAEKSVDIYTCVTRLREQRTNMVQTLVQYEFIHDFLREILTVKETSVRCTDMATVLKDQKSLYEQFELLESTKPVFKAMDLDFGKVENKDKNRDNNVVPADMYRAKLVSSPETYINAVFIDGIKKAIEFCATQVPMKTTFVEFWKFMYEEKCTSIVCLENDPNYTEWLPSPSQKSIRCEANNINLDEVTGTDGIKQYKITIQVPDLYENAAGNDSSGAESHSLKVFMPEDWAKKTVNQRNPKELVNLYSKILQWQKQSGDKMITVLCLNGAKETGLYIATHKILDIASTQGEVDIFHAVKQIRKKRPQLVSTKEQYILLHKAVQVLMSQFEEYVNVKELAK